MSTFNLSKRIKIVVSSPNVDSMYGPYSSVSVANADVNILARAKGKTVGVLINGGVVEYWWKSGITDSDLVLKVAEAGAASVGLSMPSGFAVSNSPVTSAGTIAVAGAGSTAQFIDGTGGLQNNRFEFNTTSLTGIQSYDSNTASGDYSFAIGYGTSATGNSAVAMGQGTSATSIGSIALGGGGTTASGIYSIAMGVNTTASGDRSTAMGNETAANGKSSTAMGFQSTASDYASLVIGQYNLSGYTVTNSATAFNIANTAFVIGNGTAGASINRSDAFKVLFNGNTTSAGTFTASSFIKQGGTSSQYLMADGSTSASSGSGAFEEITESGKTGIRQTGANANFYGDIGTEAVDLSYSNASSTTRGATGDYSVAMGYNTTASGDYSTATGQATIAGGNYSTAMGEGSEASGTSSTATGRYTEASGNYSTAMGKSTVASGSRSTATGGSTTASGDYSTATGYSAEASGGFSTATGNDTTASGESSTAMGRSTKAIGIYATALGTSTEARGSYSTAMGSQAIAQGNGSTAIGNTTVANGVSSTAMGINTTASDYGSLVIGQYNSSGSTPTSANTFNTANTAFVIGSGVDSSNKADAFKVLFNGNTTIGNNLTAGGNVTATNFILSSDKKLKNNIEEIDTNHIDVNWKNFELKSEPGFKRAGVIAQELEKKHPEFVRTDSKGVKSVAYIDLLITKIAELEARLEKAGI